LNFNFRTNINGWFVPVWGDILDSLVRADDRGLMALGRNEGGEWHFYPRPTDSPETAESTRLRQTLIYPLSRGTQERGDPEFVIPLLTLVPTGYSGLLPAALRSRSQ
jgi:hypothetical protein